MRAFAFRAVLLTLLVAARWGQGRGPGFAARAEAGDVPADPHTIEGSTGLPQELELVAVLDDFEKDGRPVWTVWTPGRDRSVAFPVGDLERVEIVDIMGRARSEPVRGKVVDLRVSTSVQYVRGLR